MNTVVTNRVVFWLSLLGIQVAGYLTLSHLHLLTLYCARGQGCEQVARYSLAHGLGIPALAMVPTAIFGLAFFLLLAICCAVRAVVSSRFLRWGIGVAQWGGAFMALFISVWLSFFEAYIIHGWCLWCLASAGIVLAIFLILTLEMLAAGRPRSRFEVALPNTRRDLGRFAAIFAVALLLDGGTAFALRHAPAAQYAAVTETTAATRSSSLLPPGTHEYGNQAASYTLVEFGDYACPHCQAAQPTVERIVARYPNTLNFAFHYTPIVNDGNNPFLVPRAAEAAAQQGKFWEMHTRLFAQAHALGPSGQPVTLGWVMATAGALGLDQARFQRDLYSPVTTRAILGDEQLSDTFHVTGVPTFFVLDPNGKSWRFNDPDTLERWLADPGRLGK